MQTKKNNLDELFRVYPTVSERIRDLDKDTWKAVENSFKKKDNFSLISNLLTLDLFPLKDSYVAFLKRDKDAINRNPNTVNRLCGRIYELGLDEIFLKCSLPKETNRQIGPLFKRWISLKSLGIAPVPIDVFNSTKDNAILSASDAQMKTWAERHLGYNRNKGLDFIARFNGKYVIGEAKFLTDFGGHQNAQF